MTRKRLDSRDRELLSMLASHPEWTYDEIAKEMGMTGRSVGYRIERLREMKVIQRANLIYFDRLGDLVYSAVLKFNTGVSPEEQEDTIEELKRHPATIQVFTGIGSFSIILLVHAEDPFEAEKLMRELVIGNRRFETYEISQITEIYSIYRVYLRDR